MQLGQASFDNLEKRYRRRRKKDALSSKLDITQLEIAATKGMITEALDETRTVEVSEAVIEARNEYQKGLLKKGEILSPEHSVYKQIAKVVAKLDTPVGTELVVVDSEDFLASYYIQGKQIIVGRGVLQYLKKHLSNFSEDHLAALLAHETEHAVTMQNPNNAKTFENRADQVMTTFDPAEEMRADAEGMKRAARAGYNPKAMLELLRAFGLTTERDGMAHPEIIDRVRYLELRLLSDEHPLAHTTKNFTAFDAEFTKWCNESSDVYRDFENLLNLDRKSLDKKQRESKTLKEFFQTLTYRKNTLYSAKTKTLRDNPWKEEMLTLLLAYDVLSKIEGNYPKSLYYTGKLRAIVDPNTYQYLSEAHVLMERLDAVALTEAEEAKLNININTEKQKLSFLIDELFNKIDLKASILTPEQQKLVDLIKNSLADPKTLETLLLERMENLDRAKIRKNREESNAKARNSGRRIPYERETDLIGGIDLQDPAKITKMKNLYGDHLLCKIFPKFQIEAWEKAKLTELLQAGDLTSEEAEFFTNILLMGGSNEVISPFLATRSKARLIKLIEFFFEHKDIMALRLSPIRDLHGSFDQIHHLLDLNQPFTLNINYIHHDSGGNKDSTGSGITALLYHLGWELYSRTYPKGHFDDPTAKYLPPTSLDLSFDEWELLLKIGLPSISHEVVKLSIRKILDAHGDKTKLPLFLINTLEKITSLPHDMEHENIDETIKLIDYRIWDDIQTQKIMRGALSHYLDKYFKAQLTNNQKNVHFQNALALAKKMRELEKRSPYEFKPQTKYDNSPVWDEEQLSEKINFLFFTFDPDNYFDFLINELTENNFLAFESWREEQRKKLSEMGEEKWRTLLKSPGIKRAKNKVLRIFLNLLIKASALNVDQELLSNISQEFSQREVSPMFLHWLSKLKKKDGLNADKIIGLITDLIPEPPLKDRYLIAAYSIFKKEEKEEYYAKIRHLIDWNADKDGKENATYEIGDILVETDEYIDGLNHDKLLEDYRTQVEARFGKKLEECTEVERKEILPELLRISMPKEMEVHWGEGLQLESYRDLIWRRYNFAESSGQYDYFAKAPENFQLQQFLAKRLRLAENMIFASENLSARIIELLKIAPEKTVVRDIYLEKIMRDIMQTNPNTEKKLEFAETLWALMSEKCPSRDFLGGYFLETKFSLEPHLLKNISLALSLINQYLPEASFSKNYFLEKLEISADLTVEELDKIVDLRMSEEGKKEISDDGLGALVVNKINEMNRSERKDFYFWLTGLSNKKPSTVFNFEMRSLGSANGFKEIFETLSPKEQMTLIDRLSLGKEGIFDLEAVSSLEKTRSQSEKSKFIEDLLSEIFVGSSKAVNILKGVMKVVLSEADPTKASKILGGLTTKLLRAKLAGDTIKMPEMAALMLSELGVVGKKVAQNLAELDFLPAEFRRELRKVQSEAQYVPKRALADLADDYGLLEGKEGIKILSFGKMLGAASNKQACLVDVEITKSGFGLPPGKYQLVGKFKRPSAQKSSNLETDLSLLEKVLAELAKGEDIAGKLPSGFLETIKDTVLRELDFNKEKQFSETLHKDIAQLDQEKKDYKLALPKIVYANDDLVLETLAPGISLREYLDRSEDHTLEKGYKSLDKARIMEEIFSEAVRELLVSGNVHADLHPGNSFISPDKVVTLIDVGMNEVLSSEQRNAVAKLLGGLVSGIDTMTKRALRDLGLNLKQDLNLKVGNFAENVNKMIEVSKSSGKKIPGLLTSLFSSISKLSTYSKELNHTATLRILKNVGGLYMRKQTGFDGFYFDNLL